MTLAVQLDFARALRWHVDRQEKKATINLVLAVSGGIDSLAMLQAAVRGDVVPDVRNSPKLNYTVAHFDHGLRPESGEDAQFVAERAQSHTLPFIQGAPSVPFSQPIHGNVESWARRERYQFLSRVRQQVGADWVCTAHTQDDVIETLLMRLCAGKELTSIAAIDETRMLLRPMLATSRQAVERYAHEHAIKFREDPTNKDLARTRNRLRHLVLPAIRAALGKQVDGALAERAVTLDCEVLTARQLACGAIKAANTTAAAVGSVPWKRAVQTALSATPEQLRWRVAEEALLPLVGYRIGNKHAKRVVKFFEGNAARIELPGVVVERKAGGLKANGRY